MRCVNCRWYHNENEVCLKDGCSVFNPSADDPCEYADNMTLFDRITESPEVLAKKLVYLCCIDRMWHSTIFPFPENPYPTREATIAATVAKLKEVDNGN